MQAYLERLNMNIFNEGTIESFAIGVDYEIIEDTLKKLNVIIDNAVSDIKRGNAYITGNCEIIPINEFCSGAVSPNSSLDVLLVLTSSQIEFNTLKFNNNKLKKFWNKIKYSWKHRKDDDKRKKKKHKIQISENPQDKSKYDIHQFNKDLLNSIVNYISKTTICSIENGIVKINGDALPFKTRIFPVINKFGSYNYFVESKNKFVNMDFKNRFKINEQMYVKYGEKYLSLLRIFNTLYFNIYNTSPNQIFIESLIFNLPEEAFYKKTNYESFIFAINYFANTNSNALISCTDSNKKIYEDDLSGVSLNKIIDFFNNIKKFVEMKY
ncbi:MAG: hypothetical protein PHR96_04615 [Clostridia bacterium]|nr:hypothetical protein [Clostridia bacterium]